MSDIIRRCEECGTVLPEGTGSNRRYCDACRKLKRKEVNRRYNMRHSTGFLNLPVLNGSPRRPLQDPAAHTKQNQTRRVSTVDTLERSAIHV